MSDTNDIQMHWRGLELDIHYMHKRWGLDYDYFYIKANAPFYKGGPDYLVKFIFPNEQPRPREDIVGLVDMWLDDWLETCDALQSADVQRSQLSLF